MGSEFSGMSTHGDINEALDEAIKTAKEEMTTDVVEWKLLEIHGLNGGFVLQNDLFVKIYADVPEAVSVTTRAFFEMEDSSASKRPFIIMLTDASVITHARRILAGEETSRIHVQGTIIKSQASYNPEWSFHIDPASVKFFELAIEVCDASITYVEEHLKEVGGATLPNCHWCPWSSRLIRELPNQGFTPS